MTNPRAVEPDWPVAIEGLGPSRIGPFTPCDGCGSGTWRHYGASALCLACARGHRTRQATPALDPLWDVLDELAEGLRREAALGDEHRRQRAQRIAQWTSLRLARLQALWHEAPCQAPPGRLVIDLDTGRTIEDTRVATCACGTCFNARYRAWLAARGLGRIGEAAPAPDSEPATGSARARNSSRRGRHRPARTDLG